MDNENNIVNRVHYQWYAQINGGLLGWFKLFKQRSLGISCQNKYVQWFLKLFLSYHKFHMTQRGSGRHTFAALWLWNLPSQLL